MSNIYLVQLNPVWEDKEATFQKVSQLLGSSHFEPGALVVLPEMFATGFSMDVSITSKDEPNFTLSILKQWAQQYQIYIMAGMVEQTESGKGKNLSVTVNPTSEEICRYQKMQPFSKAGEMDAHEPGQGVKIFDWSGFVVSPFICYDLRFPEWFRMAAEKGANLFVVIASWPQARIQHWITLLQARAIENQAYVVGVNRCGDDPFHAMPGRSMVIDPLGNIMVDAGESETVLHAKIDVDEVIRQRNDLPFLQDKRYRFTSS